MKLKFQMGGEVPPAEAQGQDEMMAQLEAMAQDIVAQVGPEGAMALAEMIMQIAQAGVEPQGQVAYDKKGSCIKPRKKAKMACGGKAKPKMVCGGKMKK